MENSLLEFLSTPAGTPVPFDRIRSEHFEPALEQTLAIAKKNLERCIQHTEVPTFANTIEAIEYCDSELLRVKRIFENLYEAHTDDELQRVAKIYFPKFSEFQNDITLNDALFARVRAVYEAEKDALSGEQLRLLERTYQRFIRTGALLSPQDKERLRAYDSELALLTNQFSENLLGATNAYSLVIRDEQDLSGIPERVRDAAKEEAVARGEPDAWVFTLKFPSYQPFMTYADNANLRQEMATAFSKRGMAAPYDNREIFIRIAKLRKERAVLLGYPSHAAYKLDDRMAKDPQRVQSFFDVLYAAARPAADREFEAIRAFKTQLTGEPELHAWDGRYIGEKMLRELYQYDDEQLRPYLSLDAVRAGLGETVGRLYGITLVERNDLPVHHPDVQTYEVRDKSGATLGLLYLDLFPRDSKRQGGWISELVQQEKRNDTDVRPHLLIVCNFTKPSGTKPALLSSFEMATLFHEFGHALHMLCSDCMYASLAGTSVLWDFVELPSQLLELWVYEPDTLRLFARHYETGEPIPEKLIEAKTKADDFMAGWMLLSQMGSSALDMAWHGDLAGAVADLETFEQAVLKPYLLFPHMSGTSHTTTFKHIADSGYDAGYYSYLWAEVLAADAFEYFKEYGLFSPEIAERFRGAVLSKGNSADPMELYVAFRGREPDPAALLRNRKLL